jgi:hypothetical protein
MTTRPLTVAHLQEIVAAFNNHDIDAIASYFAGDGQFLTARGPHSYGNRFTGPKAIADYLARRYKVIPDMRWEGERHFISGNQALSEWTVKGTPPSGDKIEWMGCDVWEFDERGKIKVKNTYWKYVERA